jgi:hypothetical protein
MRRLGAIRLLLAALVSCAGSAALAQATILQSGPWTPGHAGVYVSTGNSQPIMADSGNAANSGPGLTELLLQETGSGNPPFVAQGSGPYGTNFCDYDGPTTSAAGYHYLCFSPNAQGGALIAYGAAGLATPLPFAFNINGTTFSIGGIIGGITVGSTTVGSGSPPSILTDISGVLQSQPVSTAMLTFLGTPSSANLLAALTTSTGTGLNVFATSPSISGLTVTGSLTATGLVTNADLANSTISGISLGSNLDTLTFGSHLSASASSYNGSAAATIQSDATNADTASTIVARDSSGNFSAGTITASLTGHASLDLPLTGGTLTGALTLSPTAAAAGILLNAPSTSYQASLFFQQAGVTQWQVGQQSAATPQWFLYDTLNTKSVITANENGALTLGEAQNLSISTAGALTIGELTTAGLVTTTSGGVIGSETLATVAQGGNGANSGALSVWSCTIPDTAGTSVYFCPWKAANSAVVAAYFDDFSVTYNSTCSTTYPIVSIYDITQSAALGSTTVPNTSTTVTSVNASASGAAAGDQYGFRVTTAGSGCSSTLATEFIYLTASMRN